jgi:hypothetical protein
MAMPRTVTALVVAVVGWAVLGQAQELVGTVTVDPALSSGRCQGGFASEDLVFDGTLSVSDAGFVHSCNPDEGGVIFEIHGDLGPGPSPCLKPAGRWSSGYGAIKTMAAIDDGRHLLVGQGTTLVVVDLGDPTTMALVGEIQVPGLVNHVVVDGPFAFVAADEAGLLVIDVSNPEQPRVACVVDPPWSADRISVSGGLAAVAEPGGLRLLDISDPLRVQEVGWLATDRRVRDVSLSGSLAVISAGSIHLVDVNDPASPVIISDLDDGFGSGGTGISLVGEYLLADVSDRIHVFDVSDPAAPTLVRRDGIYPGLETIDAVGDLVVVEAGSNGARLLDLADPAKPVDRGWVRHEEPVTAATLAGPLLVVATASRLESYWVGLELNPEIEGMVQPPGWARHLAVSGSLAILGIDEQKVAVVDVEDPQRPRVRGVLDHPGPSAPVVAIHGTVACALNPESGLSVIDVADPTQPAVIGTLEELQGQDLYGAAMEMGPGFLVVGGNTLRIVDLSDPTEPWLAHEIGRGAKFAVAGDLVHVADRDSGLRILRVEQGRFVEVSTLDLGGDVQNVAVAGGRLYARVYRYTDGVQLQVVDVADPEHPVALGSLVVAGHKLAAFDDLVAVVDWDEVHVINTVDGTRPLVECTVRLPISGAPRDVVPVGRGVGLANGAFWIMDPRADPRAADVSLPMADRHAIEVTTWSDRVVVADGNLTVFDVSDPIAPVEEGLIETPGSASATASASHRLLVADSDAGLSIFDLAPGSDVGQATHRATVDVGGEALRVASADGVAYLTVDEVGLVVVDLADHTVIATLNAGIEGRNEFVRPRAVAVSEGRAYVSYFSSFWEGQYGGLHVYDISNPHRPLFLGMATDSLHEWDLAVAEDVVVGASYPWGFKVFDVSDPTEPNLIAQIDPISEAHGAAYLGGSQFVFADDLSGVFVADLSDPADPRILRRVQTPGEATGLAVTEDFVYVADGSGGLTVLDRTLCQTTAGERPDVAVD